MALLQHLWRCIGGTLPIRAGVCWLHWQYVLMTSTTPGTLQTDLPARMLMIGMPLARYGSLAALVALHRWHLANTCRGLSAFLAIRANDLNNT